MQSHQPSSACPEFRSDQFLRRDVLRIGGYGLLGLTLPRLLQAGTQPDRPRAKAKSVIFLFQFGGPSHDETLVVWMGEFGRTPKINDNISRDDWPRCYTVLLAGGGVKRGSVYGASDANGAFPERDGVQPDDLSATMFALLGIAPHAQVTDKVNRPVAISAGNPIVGVMG